MKKLWNFLGKKLDYIALIFHIIIIIICILLVQELKWKILLLVECLYGITCSLHKCFFDLGWHKSERVAEQIYKIMTFCIIIVGSIIVITGILGDSGF